MPSDTESRSRISLKGSAGLFIAIVVVLIPLIWLPAYRWFFLMSLGIGLVVWGILHLWHKYRPLTDDDVERKRPLGLD